MWPAGDEICDTWVEVRLQIRHTTNCAIKWLTLHTSHAMRKPIFVFATRQNTNQYAQPQKLGRGLKFRI